MRLTSGGVNLAVRIRSSVRLLIVSVAVLSYSVPSSRYQPSNWTFADDGDAVTEDVASPVAMDWTASTPPKSPAANGSRRTTSVLPFSAFTVIGCTAPRVKPPSGRALP